MIKSYLFPSFISGARVYSLRIVDTSNCDYKIQGEFSMPRYCSIKYLSIAICTITAVLVATPSHADILNVPAQYPTIRAAINAASNGDEVVVADGIYTGPDNRNLSFNGKAITVRSENGPNNCIIDCEGQDRAFNFNSNETSESVLEGFNIRNGGNVTYGGGVKVSQANPTINNMIFDLCTAEYGGAMDFGGSNSTLSNIEINGCTATYGAGGLKAVGSNLTISNLNITGCESLRGAGFDALVDCNITIQGGSITDNNATYVNGGDGGGARVGSNSNVTFNNVDFHNNSATGLGGGVYVNNSTVDLNGGTCNGNGANFGGGVAGANGSTINIDGGNYTGNIADIFGGAILSDNTDTTITLTEFLFNIGVTGGGACATSSGSSLTAILCRMAHNIAGNPNSGGGGDGGALFNLGIPATIIACTFENNTASRGGAIYNSLCNLQSTNCLFFNNTATSFGGAVYNASSQPQFKLATMWGNTAATSGGAFYNNATLLNISNSILRNDSPSEFVNVGGSTTTATFSNIQGGWTGAGNINQNPMFVSQNQGDFNLSPGSPCIDAGKNSAVPGWVETDLAENPRFVDDPDTKDTGVGDPPLVDMGALEFQILSSCPWDLDGSGSVGTGDLLTLFTQWGTDGPADFDGSGAVGTGDLLILFANWGPCP